MYNFYYIGMHVVLFLQMAIVTKEHNYHTCSKEELEEFIKSLN